MVYKASGGILNLFSSGKQWFQDEMISHTADKSVTCTIVGDGMVGKSQLCKTFVGDLTIEDYKATVTDEHHVLTQLMGDKYSLRIVDSSGQVSSVLNTGLFNIMHMCKTSSKVVFFHFYYYYYLIKFCLTFSKSFTKLVLVSDFDHALHIHKATLS